MAAHELGQSQKEPSSVRSVFEKIKAGVDVDGKLDAVTTDTAVNIRIASLNIEKDGLSFFAARIAAGTRVNAHVHRHGDEPYYIVEGEGEMSMGPVSFDGDSPVQTDWQPVARATSGSILTVPEGYAHSLENTGEQPLVILFGCLPTHLQAYDQGGDRYMVENPPENAS